LFDAARHPPRHHSQRRWPRRVLLLAAAGFVLAVAAGLALMVPVRGDLDEARGALSDGRDALVGGDPRAAHAAFEDADDAFARAADGLANLFTRFVGTLPILGRSPDAVAAIARGGGDVARAGVVLSEALRDVPGGLSALAPRAGTIPLRPLARLRRPLRRAADLAARADTTAAAAPRGWILPPIAGPFDTFRAEAGQLRRTLATAVALAERLPTFLGEDRTRRYFVGAQNPAELRGTGGLIGAYSILTVRDGRLELGPFRDVNALPSLGPSDVEPPNGDYARRYDRYGGAGFWKNINMTPDFPSAATAIERLYREVAGTRLDGTILTDPSALASLVAVTGPVRAPGLGRMISEDEIVPFLSNEAYSIYTDTSERKRLLGAMAGEVLGRYLVGASDDPQEAVKALVESAAAGHLLIHSSDPSVQGAFDLAGVSGRLLPPEDDHLVVIANNAGGNKLDYYVRRTVRYVIRLGTGGVGEARATLRFENRAPDSGEPAYVIGPFPGVSEAGEDVMITDVLCGRCRLEAARQDGSQDAVLVEEELANTAITNEVRLASGDATTLEYQWTVPDAWAGSAADGRYRLRYQGQATIRPTRLEVVIVAPPGTEISLASPGMEVHGRTATWSGTPGDAATLNVEFGMPLPVRVLRGFLLVE
jgi:hypothetical protein